ncbi:hypothetical protein CLV98_101347 [Dyadobacter jejuensis]|uniref:Outer membrane protein beta-barrel domain-containing protein n=1 Tax=Dyadobacter jejuensis TaxID=1082580 RepID=A0A316AU17_9BACT|nr:hypothetical protein [Dyadobacter jejuensis]PWJ60170.1 hypothetical protein CLV98_101347 [Dyadobacter jejuensis]
MKKLPVILIGMLLLICGLVRSEAHPATSVQTAWKDSIVISIGNKTRLVIVGENQKELEKLLQYDINALLRDLKIRLDSSQLGTTLIVENFDGERYQYIKEGEAHESVRIDINGIHVQTDRVVHEDNEDEEDDDEGEGKKHTHKFYRNSKGSSPRKGFDLSFGFNTYVQNEATPGYVKSDYDLRPFGSRYVKLGYVASGTIVRGEHAKLFLDLGADFSWNNLMFEGDNTVQKGNERIQFVPVTDSNGATLDLKKSKLVLPYVNLSLMPTISFSKTLISYISAGVYGGYRIGGYTKVRQEGSKDIQKERSDFYVNDLRYGIGAELGIRNFVNLFVQYDLNEVYRTNHGPSVRMINFGIKL